MRYLLPLLLLSLLSGCGLPNCSSAGHVTSCSFNDAGTVECVDAGWLDAGVEVGACDEWPLPPYPPQR
jgi:hypothetical protein